MFIIAVLHILSLFIPLHFTDQRARTWSSNQSEVHWEIVAESGSTLLQWYYRNGNCNIQTLVLAGTEPTRFSRRQKHSLDPKKRNSSKKHFKHTFTHFKHTFSQHSLDLEKEKWVSNARVRILNWLDRHYTSRVWQGINLVNVSKFGVMWLKWRKRKKNSLAMFPVFGITICVNGMTNSWKITEVKEMHAYRALHREYTWL